MTVLVKDSLKDANKSLYTQRYLMSVEVIDSKIHKSAPPVKKIPPKIFQIFLTAKLLGKLI